jgi:uncharacterized protein (TIGR02452 family)
VKAYYKIRRTSAKHPGGGFQNGSLAQEEDIAYRSTLFVALNSKPEYYKESHRNLRNGLYFDKMLYTEGLVVIRDANYKLTKPWYCNCITAPAPRQAQIAWVLAYATQDLTTYRY